MKTIRNYALIISALVLAAACDRRDDDVVNPRNPEDFPINILLSDEADGDIEDNDEVGIALEILPIWDPVTRDPEGIVPTPAADLRVYFELFDPSGFSSFSEYILGGEVIYEIDDCTDSSDEGIEIHFEFDAATGTGHFDWPAGIAELEVVFALNETLFDDDVPNADPRGFSFRLTGIEGTGAGRAAVVNTGLEFTYFALDDESIFGTWEADHNNPDIFSAFMAFFTPLMPDLEGIEPQDIDVIEFEFGIEGLAVIVVLNETEKDPCEPGAFENVEIELEAEYAIDFEDLFAAGSGDLEFEGEAEINDINTEFELEGNFKLDGKNLTLTLTGELDGDDLGKITLTLAR